MPNILLQDVDKYAQGLTWTDKYDALRLLNKTDLNLASFDIKILNRLSSLPNCEKLDCHGKKLFRLPLLPKCKTLHCQDNLLTELPPLPKCKILLCSKNQLTKLPDLPFCEYLYCSDNLLTELPELPYCKTLFCSNNFLIDLPSLPHIESLNCSYNSFPTKPVFSHKIMLQYKDSNYTSKLHLILDIYKYPSWTKIIKLCPDAQLSWLPIFYHEVCIYIKNKMKGFEDLHFTTLYPICENFKVNISSRDEKLGYLLLRKIADSKNTHTVC
jgi:hypothetical protein